MSSYLAIYDAIHRISGNQIQAIKAVDLLLNIGIMSELAHADYIERIQSSKDGRAWKEIIESVSYIVD